jgi:hypothetical protein
VHIGQPEVSSLELVGQPLVIDAQAMQHRRLRIVHVHRIGHHVVAIIVRRSMFLHGHFIHPPVDAYGFSSWIFSLTS